MQRICHVNEVNETKPLRVKLQGLDLLVCRSTNGRFFVIQNLCSHQDLPLHCGSWDGELCQLKCPAHGAVFSLINQGKPLTPPAFSSLELFPCEIRQDEVFADLN